MRFTSIIAAVATVAQAELLFVQPNELSQLYELQNLKSAEDKLSKSMGKKIMELVNAERSKAGLKALVWSKEAFEGADLQA